MKYIFSILFVCTIFIENSYAYYNNPPKIKSGSTEQLRPRSGNCDPATQQIDLEINNVRARLLNGGDGFWDLKKGSYIVPKVEPGQPEVSSIFAGGVWVGGFDPAGVLKLMAQTYRSGSANDCWPGPLEPNTGDVTKEECKNWDRFFTVSGDNITKFKKTYNDAGGRALDPSEIPEDVLYWPGRGNTHFIEKYKFELPNYRQGLGNYYNVGGTSDYEPEFGDYPSIDIRGCRTDLYPDQMIYWIYNDNGGVHTNSKAADPIRMEVQVQAFGFRTGDQINDMTFYRYKLINRAPQDLRDCYFAMWIDPDLGCSTDDYIGCNIDTIKNKPRNLMYMYNIDAQDGSNGCTCSDAGVNTYCDHIPILGIDYFRGPKDVNDKELGMNSFMYYNRSGSGPQNPATVDPSTTQQYYNYMTGKWLDNTRLTKGGTGYNPGSADFSAFAFSDAPNNPAGWSMCAVNAGEADRRTIQATGPMLLTPGATNELIIGAVWVPDQNYPCPDITELLTADDLAQDLFDNCFDIKDGPDAPDVEFVQLDQEIIILLSNEKGSNNFNESPEDYQETGIGFPPNTSDTLYRFEGYRIFQVANSTITLNDITLNDPTKVREVANVDVKNGIKKLYNWKSINNPNPSTTKPKVFYPVEVVSGTDEGIRHSFSIKEDQFAESDRALINHKKYYYLVIAYGYNNFANFSPDDYTGQKMQYCPGRLNIGPDGDGKPYTAIPRPPVYDKLNTKYGDGVEITRIEGIGAGHNFLRLKSEMYDKMLQPGFDGIIDYQTGSGPINVKVVNPIAVKDGEFEVRFTDANMSDKVIDKNAKWEFQKIGDANSKVISAGTIEKLNEQIISNYGISLSIGQTLDAGNKPLSEKTTIGLEAKYKDESKIPWFAAVPDGSSDVISFQARQLVSINYVKTELAFPIYYNQDPQSLFTTMGEGFYKGSWVPYKLCYDSVLMTPAWIRSFNRTIANAMKLDSLNNVDIVFTSDKSKWSRCIVVETWNSANGATEPVTGNQNFSVKPNPSVSKFDNDGNGIADPDNDGTTGFGWFPGYAVDVETGKRLNIFFGENSFYSDDDLIKDCIKSKNGNDMMWNPSDQLFADAVCGNIGELGLVFGGHHYIYVTKQKYDSCNFLKKELATQTLTRRKAIQELTWCSMPQLIPGASLLPLGSGATGLIPNDLVFSLRVDNPYQYTLNTNENSGHNLYRFKISGKETTKVTSQSDFETVLEDVNVVPNPYYGFSQYENGQFSNIVKITNLPAKCEVTIYSVDGKFIKKYSRDEVGDQITSPYSSIKERQITPDVEWDLTNFKNIPVSAGAYLIHIKEKTTGAERIVKWFGVARKFDPSGL